MAAYFFDLDGTLLKSDTGEPLEGAIEAIKKIRKAGHQVIITTKRGRNPSYAERRKQETYKHLADAGIEFDHILFGVESPRIIVNDRGCGVIRHEQNEPWSIDPLLCLEGLDPGS